MSNIITQQLSELKRLQSKIFIIVEQLEKASLISTNENELKTIEKLLLDVNLNFYNDNISLLLKSIKPIIKICNKVNKKYNKKEVMEQYAKYTVDPKEPIIIDRTNAPLPVQISYSEIQENSINETGNIISPIDRKKELEYKGECKFCGAPNEYIYSMGNGKFLCKCCTQRFSFNIRKHAELSVICPYCDRTCDQQKDKDIYFVYKCRHDDCPHFLKNKKLVKNGQADHLKVDSKYFKMHYIYRYHKTPISELSKSAIYSNNLFDTTKLHHSRRVVGMVLTYVINYGLSYRKVSLILKQMHGVTISPTTIYRYVTQVSSSIKYLVDNYDYDLSDDIGADETYVKVKGKNNYVFFYSDIKKKIITSYKIYNRRSSKECLESMFDTLRKYKHFNLPKKLSLTVDANPIYQYCQSYFKHHKIEFDLRIVTGVSNLDNSSILYRSGKQVQERLNRTYKSHYNGMNGYSNLNSANSYMVMFVAFFNFLRGHSSLGFKCPVELPIFEEQDLIQDKWMKLIDYSSILQSQSF